MKTGDKILCKKHLMNNVFSYHFIKGKMYKVVNVVDASTSGVYIYVLSEEYTVRFQLIDEFRRDDYKFFDYFYNEKELRKLKLEKLNGQRIR